jgi:hypothetical protein
VLDGVHEQVRQHLQEPVRLGRDDEVVRHGDHELAAVERQPGYGPPRHLGEADRGAPLLLDVLHPRQFEQILHEQGEPLRLAARDREVLTALRLARVEVGPLKRSQDAERRGERRAELMGDVRDQPLAQVRELSRSGTGYTVLGYYNYASGSMYQTVAIPSGHNAGLTFWLNVTSDETTTSTVYDRLYVEVRSTSGALLGTLGTFSNLNKAALGSYTQRSFSIASWRGQTVRLQFRATTDSTLPTSFRVDDVSLS